MPSAVDGHDHWLLAIALKMSVATVAEGAETRRAGLTIEDTCWPQAYGQHNATDFRWRRRG